ncbi:DNA-binding protein [Salmonella enterica subsp. enterica]|uniref:DNA-binding protein n=1 Tax=Salmonella enterica TaxID=28901 RepID=UPI00344B38F3
MAISKADVVNACNELYAQGKNVTLDAVRAITGGSFSTISPLVKEWKAEQSGVNASLESSVARTDVPEKLTELLNTLWSAAMATASQKLEAERQLLNDYKTELENERSDVMFAADRISAELDDLKFDFSCLNTKYKETTEKADNFERENISLRAEIEAQNKIIANNESVLGELTRFLKSLNDTVPAAAPAPATDKENHDAPASAESSVNSDTAIKNESKPAPSEIKPASQSVSKAKNKATNKKNAAAGNAPGSSLPVRGKTVTGNVISQTSGVVA